MTELGIRHLRGVAEPHRLFQLGGGTFAPLRAVDPAVSNLPGRPTPLIGRDPERGRTCGLVGEHRLVTLTGAGGSGKTRLAVEVADTVGARFRDGVWFVELAAVVDAAVVPDAMASSLGVSPQADTPISQTLVDTLVRKDLLLVLDNCEHVLSATTDLVRQLLVGADGPRILATSREPLQARGEYEVPVLPLVTDDAASPAVTLFAERARSVRPNFSLDDHPATAAAALEICRRLDGLPLGRSPNGSSSRPRPPTVTSRTSTRRSARPLGQPRRVGPRTTVCGRRASARRPRAEQRATGPRGRS